MNFGALSFSLDQNEKLFYSDLIFTADYLKPNNDQKNTYLVRLWGDIIFLPQFSYN